MTDLNYVIVITITSLALQIFFHLYHKIDTAVKLDAIGLAAFSVIGLKVALSQGVAPCYRHSYGRVYCHCWRTGERYYL